MRDEERQLPEDIAHEILELAARNYTEQTNQEQAAGYTVTELIDAGIAASIPDEYIQQAIKEVEARNRENQAKKPTKPEFKYGLIVVSAIALIPLVTLVFKINLPNVATKVGSDSDIVKTNKLNPLTKVKLKALGDTFSGYSTLRNLKFHNALQKQNIELTYKYEFDQKARAQALDKGKVDFIVTTLDRYLIYQPQGKIVS